MPSIIRLESRQFARSNMKVVWAGWVCCRKETQNLGGIWRARQCNAHLSVPGRNSRWRKEIRTSIARKIINRIVILWFSDIQQSHIPKSCNPTILIMNAVKETNILREVFSNILCKENIFITWNIYRINLTLYAFCYLF